LSGHHIRDEKCQRGDIDIEVTGLRPGEKLYEELLIGDNPQPTSHAGILKANEEFVSWDELRVDLMSMQIAIENNDIAVINTILLKLVKGYKPDEKIVDWVYMEQNR